MRIKDDYSRRQRERTPAGPTPAPSEPLDCDDVRHYAVQDHRDQSLMRCSADGTRWPCTVARCDPSIEWLDDRTYRLRNAALEREPEHATDAAAEMEVPAKRGDTVLEAAHRLVDLIEGTITTDEFYANSPGVDYSDYMCPNCLTPWRCNGPHIPEGGQ